MPRLCAAVAALALAFAPAVRADDEKPKGQKPAPADAPKVVVIQLDASKLPPELLKQLMQLSKPTEAGKPAAKPEGTKPAPKPEGSKPEGTKPAVKSVTLVEAVAIAEKVGKGTAVKAEREDEDGKVQFEVQVIDGKGGKTEYKLDATGKVVSSEPKGTKAKGDDKEGGEGKPKPKGEGKEGQKPAGNKG
jgi:uncharacterized membrane protein YkoI